MTESKKSLADMTPEETLEFLDFLFDPPLTEERRKWYIEYMNHETMTAPWDWPDEITSSCKH